MPKVQVTLIAAHRPSGHKRVVLRYGDSRVVLPITSPKVEHFDFAADWQEVQRGDDRPLLGIAGRKLHGLRFDATIARRDGTSVEDILNNLVNMSRGDDHTVTMHNYGWFEAGPWRMTEITFPSDMRKLGTNQITRAVVTITLKEAVPEPGPRATKKKRKPAKDTKDRGGRPKTYTVKAGDTLSAIAARFYGDANQWHKIARANNIRDPRKLRIGQVLKLP